MSWAGHCPWGTPRPSERGSGSESGSGLETVRGQDSTLVTQVGVLAPGLRISLVT